MRRTTGTDENEDKDDDEDAGDDEDGAWMGQLPPFRLPPTPSLHAPISLLLSVLPGYRSQ